MCLTIYITLIGLQVGCHDLFIGENMSQRGTEKERLVAALVHHRAGRLKKAQRLYEKVLKSNPKSSDANHLLGVLIGDQGDVEGAKLSIARAITIAPTKAHYHVNMGNLYEKTGDSSAALDAFRRAYSLDPEQVEAINNLVSILRRQGDYDERKLLLENLIIKQPEWNLTHYHWGNLLLDQGNREEAVSSYNRAIHFDPLHANSYNNLGNALLSLGRAKEAEAAFSMVLKHDPSNAEGHNNLGNSMLADGRIKEAADQYRLAIAARPNYGRAYYNLGTAFVEMGKLPSALFSYQRSLKIDPGNQSALHMVAALSGNSTDAAPDSYVRNLFDGYAENFEKHLVDTLNYDIPSRLAKLFVELEPGALGEGIDLGCGTGLAGVAFRSCVERLTGVDLSGQMIELARQKKVYDQLETDNIVNFLSQKAPLSYSLFLAVDVFNYVGDLMPVFREMGRRATPGAWLVFSTEGDAMNDEGFHLGQFGRFLHSSPYIEKIAAEWGFTVVKNQREKLRRHRDEWIEGNLFFLQFNLGNRKNC